MINPQTPSITNAPAESQINNSLPAQAQLHAPAQPHNPTPVTELRKFGWIMATAFAVIGFWPLFKPEKAIRLWAVIPALLFLAFGAVRPSLLAPVFRLWMKLGHALGWVNSRIILAIVFYLMMTPIGILLKILKKSHIAKQWTKEPSYRVPSKIRDRKHMEHTF